MSCSRLFYTRSSSCAPKSVLSKALPPLHHANSFTTSPPQSNFLGLPPPINASSVLSPIASRIREQDASALAEYKQQQRNRSGSATTQTSDTKSTTTSTTVLSSNTSAASVPVGPSTPQPDRRLRPSYSAAQLRSTAAPPPPEKTESSDPSDPQGSRSRSGTAPVPTRSASSPMEANFPAAVQSLERKTSAKRAGTVPARSQFDGNGSGGYTGPPSDYAVFPDPPTSNSTRPTEQQGTPSKPSTRRAPFAILSKPLPSIDSTKVPREHRKAASEVRV